MTIAEFLTARWDDTERLATAAAAESGEWSVNDEEYAEYIITGDGTTPVAGVALHIAANDPAFVLADIAAKREILRWILGSQWVAEQGRRSPYAQGELDAYHTVLVEMVKPYASHPDFEAASSSLV